VSGALRQARNRPRALSLGIGARQRRLTTARHLATRASSTTAEHLAMRASSTTTEDLAIRAR
jgi:hypothetical protein